MWLFVVRDVTSNSQIQQPDHPQAAGQVGMNLSDTVSDGWIGGGTVCAVA